MAETLSNVAVNMKSNFSQREDADHPPDSYTLSKDAEIDWFARNAFFERNYSTKANSNANANTTSIVPKQLRKSDSSIIWIPKTQRRSSFPDVKIRRAQPPPIRLVPRRNDVVKTMEPSSPKVSCTGRVRQKKNKPAKNLKSKKTKTTPLKRDTQSDQHRKSSGTLWTRLRAVFRSGKLKAQSNEVAAQAMTWRIKRSKSSRVQQSSLGDPAPVSLTRFASGRKSDSWIMEIRAAIEEVDTQRSDQMGIGLWSRRNLNAPEPIDCSRDWLDSGPASV